MKLNYDFKKHKETIYLLLSYTAIAFIVTWPWLPNFLTCLPSSGGDASQCTHEIYATIKNLKNFSNPFFDQTQGYPVGSYYYQAISLFMSTTIAILYFITNHFVFSVNFILLLAFVLSSYYAYKLINYFCEDKIASFTGSLIFVFSNKYINFFKGHYTRMMTMFSPLFIYRYAKFIDKKDDTWKDILINSGIVILLLFSDPYVFITTLFFIVLYEIWLFISKRDTYFTIESIKTRWAKIGVMLLPAICIGIYLTISADIKGYSLFKVLDWLGADVANLDVASIIVKDSIQTFKFPFYANFVHETKVYVGIWIILIILAACIIKKTYKDNVFKMMLFCAIMYFIFALGPVLRFNGENQFEVDFLKFSIPMPFYFLMHAFTFLRNFRVPTLFAHRGLLFIGVLLAISLKALFSKTKNSTLKNIGILLIGALLIVDNLEIPVYLEKYSPPPVFEYLRNEPPGTMLYLPNTLLAGDSYLFKEKFPHSRNAHIMFYQNYYDKDLIFAYLPRTEKPLLFLREHPVISSFYYLPVDFYNASSRLAEIPEKDKDNFIRMFNLKYVLVGRPLAVSPYLETIRNFFGKYIVSEKIFYSPELENETILVGNTNRKNNWLDYNNSVLFTLSNSIPNNNVIKIDERNQNLYTCYIKDKIKSDNEREELYFVFPKSKTNKKIEMTLNALEGDYDLYLDDDKEIVTFPATGLNNFTFNLNNISNENNIKGRIVPKLIDKEVDVNFDVPEKLLKWMPISVISFGVNGYSATDKTLWLLNIDFIKIKDRKNTIEWPTQGINIAVINSQTNTPNFFQSKNLRDENTILQIKDFLLNQPDGSLLIISNIFDGSFYFNKEMVEILKRNYGASGNYNQDNLIGQAYIFVGVKNRLDIIPIEKASSGKLILNVNKDIFTIKDLTRKIEILEVKVLD